MGNNSSSLASQKQQMTMTAPGKKQRGMTHLLVLIGYIYMAIVSISLMVLLTCGIQE